MPTNSQQIETIKTQTLALMVDLTLNPKPNYDIDGQNISWADYLERLQNLVAWCDDQLATVDGPFELETYGYPG